MSPTTARASTTARAALRTPITTARRLAAASCAGEVGRPGDDPRRADRPDFSFLPRDFIAEEKRAVDRTSLIWS